MAGIVSTNRRKRRKSNSKSKARNQLNLQKPSGVIGHRVKQVGGEKFAIVCVDPAKHQVVVSHHLPNTHSSLSCTGV